MYLDVPFSGANLDEIRKAFNRAMSKGRISLEWYFMEVKHLWSLVDVKRKLRVRKMPAGLIYKAVELLTNLNNSTNTNLIAQYLSATQPGLEN